MPTPTADTVTWPGRRLGLPQAGPRSVGRFGRRLGAVVLDWALATGVTWLLVREQNGWLILGVFALLQLVFIPTLGGSLGHLAWGLRVVPLSPGWIGVLKPVIRTALLCIVIPAAIWDVDQRGLHDRLAGTVLVRR